jgi:hypothetical protein
MGCKNKQETQYYKLWAMIQIIEDIFYKLSRAFSIWLFERKGKIIIKFIYEKVIKGNYVESFYATCSKDWGI